MSDIAGTRNAEFAYSLYMIRIFGTPALANIVKIGLRYSAGTMSDH
jgi:hypothetical protein